MPTIQKTRKIYEFVKEAVRANGMPPTLKEIGKAFGMTSVSSVHKHVEKMELQGWIKRVPNVSRGIRIVEQETIEAA